MLSPENLLPQPANPKTTPQKPPQEPPVKCPRCDSPNTKFCYYNNYSLTQPRHFCKTCRRYWTRGGALREIELPSLGSGHRRIILKLIEAGFHIMIINYGIEANFDSTSLKLAMENCLGNPLLLKLKGKTFERFTASDLLSFGVQLPPHVFHALECEFPSSLIQMEDTDDSESEAYPIVDVIDIKENGLIEITGMVVKNQTEVPIKWTVIDGSKKVKSGFEKGVSLNADTVTSQGSHGNSAVTPESSFLVISISSLLKMLRFIGENAQIFYTGGISAIVGAVSPLLQLAGAKDTASVDYVRMVAFASGVLFAIFSWMLSVSKSKKDLGTIAAACAFFSMIIGLFSAIFSRIVPEYRFCLIGIIMILLLVVAFSASGDQDMETTSESGGDPDPSSTSRRLEV